MALNIKPFYPLEHPDLTYEIGGELTQIEPDTKNNINYRKKEQSNRRLRKKEEQGKKKKLAEVLVETLNII